MFPSAAGSSPDSGSLNLVQKLTAAIQGGENDLAVKLVTELTKRRLKLDIGVPKEDNEIRSKEAEFSVKVYIEDRLSTGVTINLNVKSCDTIGDLKRKMMLKYNFPVEVQRWIVHKRIPEDKEKLSKCGVKEAGFPLFLYLVTARSVGLTKQQYETHKREIALRDPDSANMNNSQAHLSRESSADQISSWNPSPLTPVDSPIQYFSNSHLGMSAQIPFQPESSQAMQPLTPLSINPGSRQSADSGSTRVQEMLLSPTLSAAAFQPNYSANKPVENDFTMWQNIVRPPSPGPSRSRSSRSTSPSSAPRSTTPPPQPEQEVIGWTCLRCTLINLPMRPGCAACTGPRPADYIVPENYQVTPEEKDLMENAERLERLTRQEAVKNYQDHLAVDDLPLLRNREAFTCPICFDDFNIDQGIVLRECLHMFCRDCLKGAVQHSEDPELQCPFQDDYYSCQALMQEREIKALVEPDIYAKFLQRGLTQAESQATNSYHCKTSDCIGWCFYEDLVNFFYCHVCEKENCLTCKAIHEGMNCQQYQDDLRIRANNDVAAKQTQEMLENLVRSGDAMLCPQCGVVVQKKDGCDWIKCSICKTEICWVTKMSRWGPNGNGDITGGCKCRVNNRKCHPDCINCH